MKPAMLFKQLLLAASAAAFLVVPEVTKEDEEAFKALPIDDSTLEILPIATAQSIDVPCHGCRGRHTHLQMDFAVEDGTRLTMNGFELYPEADPIHGELSANVVGGHGRKKEQKLGYSLGVSPGPNDEAQGMQLVNVELQVMQVGGKFVNGIPPVLVQLVKAGDEVIIGKIEMQAPPAAMPRPEEPECETLWCAIRNRIKNAKEALRQGGCGRHHRHGAPGNGDDYHHHGPGPNSHGHHGHGPYGHRRHGHNWGKLIKKIAINVVLPVLMGLAAGVGVAVVAMSLCSCLAIFIKTRRTKRHSKRRCPFHRNKAAINEPATEEEKTGLADDQDLPPVYEQEDVPQQTV